MSRNNGGQFTWNGSGYQVISSNVASAIDAIQIQTNNGGGANGSILINSRSSGTGKLKLKTLTDLQLDLAVAPTVGQVLSAKNVSGDVEWSDAGGEIPGLLALYDADNYDGAANTWPDSSGNSFGTATLQAGSANDPILNTLGVGQPYLECDDSHLRVDRTGTEWTQFSNTRSMDRFYVCKLI